MKIVKSLAIVLATASATAAFAAPSPIDASKVTTSRTVSYSCQQGKGVTVKYGFNKAGIPVTASAKVNGVNRVMRYDMATSDNMGTTFKDRAGYNLNMDGLELSTVRKASIVNISNGNSQILYKLCSPR